MQRICVICGCKIPDDYNEGKCPDCGGIWSDDDMELNKEVAMYWDEVEWIIRCPLDDQKIVKVDYGKSICTECALSEDDSCRAKPSYFRLNFTETKDKDCSAICLYEIKGVLDDNLIMTVNTQDHIIKHKTLISETGMLGKKGNIDVDYFVTDKYISDQHCKFIQKDSKWFVRVIGETNPTILNQIQLPHGINAEIKNEDYLQIADKLFVVKVVYDYVD